MSKNNIEDELVRLRRQMEDMVLTPMVDEPVVAQICTMDKLPLLSVEEASMFFNLGTKKIYQVANNYPELVLKVGNKILIKRERFEKFVIREDEI